MQPDHDSMGYYLKISNPDLIYICIALKQPEPLERDRFFICRKHDIQVACIQGYREYMEKHNWTRPKNYKSMDNRLRVDDLIEYEDNWNLILNELGPERLRDHRV